MPLHLEIITADRVLFGGQVDVVVAPGAEGQMAVLPHHAAVMTSLEPGELRYQNAGGETYVAISGGFMDVRGSHVVVLADSAERADEIDEARAQEAIIRAQERLAERGEDADVEQALQSLRRAQVRVAVTRRRRRQSPTAPGSAPL
ncbi:MAG: F0F1 ATP synthase subunit epsilon [Dehalococcoidia bacterium]